MSNVRSSAESSARAANKPSRNRQAATDQRQGSTETPPAPAAIPEQPGYGPSTGESSARAANKPNPNRQAATDQRQSSTDKRRSSRSPEYTEHDRGWPGGGVIVRRGPEEDDAPPFSTSRRYRGEQDSRRGRPEERPGYAYRERPFGNREGERPFGNREGQPQFGLFDWLFR